MQSRADCCRRRMQVLCAGAMLFLSTAALSEGTPARFYSGIQFMELTGEYGKQLAADGSQVLVVDVVPDGPADRTGITRGDVITAVGGTPITDGASFLKAISGEISAPEVEVRVYRFGKRYAFTLRRGTDPDPGFAELLAMLRRIESDYVDEIPLNALIDRAVAGMYWAVGEDPPPVTSASSPEAIQLRRLSAALAAIRESHPQTDARTILAGAMEHLAKLDAHSGYTPAIAQTSGNAGVGLALRASGGTITVVRAIPGSPADAGGIRPGDVVEEINGIPVGGASLEEAWARILGPEATPVRLTLSRRGAARRTITLTRKPVGRSEVECPAVLDHVAYVRLTYLAKTTGDSLRDTLARLTPADAPLRGLVLDLRDNPGGDLFGAVAVTNLFLKSGRIVFIQSRSEHQTFSVVAAPENAAWPDLPIAVLVNDGTAGFAQIVAAALQDHHRATLVGTPTAGDSDIQYRFPIGGGTLRLTTSRALRLSDKPVDRVLPEITVHANLHSLKDLWHPCSANIAPPEEDQAIQFAINALHARP